MNHAAGPVRVECKLEAGDPCLGLKRLHEMRSVKTQTANTASWNLMRIYLLATLGLIDMKAAAC